MNTPFFRRVALPINLLAAATTVSLTGCETSDPSPGTEMSGATFPKPAPPPENLGRQTTAWELFNDEVGPSLYESCADCHAHAESGAPVFLGETLGASYVTLVLYGGMVSFPYDSLLIHEGTHAGPDVTDEQRHSIRGWLGQEIAERGIALVPETTLEQALPMIGACMSQADWTTNGLDALASVDTDGSGVCSDCHSDGTGGVYLSTDATATFQVNRQSPFINRWVRAQSDVFFKGFTAADSFVKTASSAGCDPKAFVCHPTYQLSPSLSDGINKFIAATLARWHNVRRISSQGNPQGG